MAYRYVSRLLKTYDSRRLVYRREMDTGHGGISPAKVLIFMALLTLLIVSPVRTAFMLLLGPMTLIYSTQVYSRYRLAKLGPRGKCNMVILSALTMVMTLAGLIFGLIPGIIIGSYLMFAPMHIIYRRQGVFGALSGSIRTANTDFPNCSALWLLTSLQLITGLLMFFGFRFVEEALQMRRIAFKEITA